MAWDVPQFRTGGANQGQAISQSIGGISQQRPQQGGVQGQQGGILGQVMPHPVAASSTDMAGNTNATSGTMMGGSYFPSSQGQGMDWGAAISRLMGLGV